MTVGESRSASDRRDRMRAMVDEYATGSQSKALGFDASDRGGLLKQM